MSSFPVLLVEDKDSLRAMLRDADAYGKAQAAYAKDKSIPRPAHDVVLAHFTASAGLDRAAGEPAFRRALHEGIARRAAPPVEAPPLKSLSTLPATGWARSRSPRSRGVVPGRTGSG